MAAGAAGESVVVFFQHDPGEGMATCEATIPGQVWRIVPPGGLENRQYALDLTRTPWINWPDGPVADPVGAFGRQVPTWTDV